MKTATLCLAAIAPLVAAFPRSVFEESRPEILERARAILAERQAGAGAATAVFEPANTFNAARQAISINGSHAYVAPGAG